jgi:hypothetical protein
VLCISLRSHAFQNEKFRDILMSCTGIGVPILVSGQYRGIDTEKNAETPGNFCTGHPGAQTLVRKQVAAYVIRIIIAFGSENLPGTMAT